MKHRRGVHILIVIIWLKSHRLSQRGLRWLSHQYSLSVSQTDTEEQIYNRPQMPRTTKALLVWISWLWCCHQNIWKTEQFCKWFRILYEISLNCNILSFDVRLCTRWIGTRCKIDGDDWFFDAIASFPLSSHSNPVALNTGCWFFWYQIILSNRIHHKGQKSANT